MSLGFAQWMAKKKHWQPVAWHHSSKFHNKVNFYDLDSLRRIILHLGYQLENLRHLGGRRASVRGEYARWEGTGHHRHIVAWVTFKDVLDGNGWIHLPDGTRKKASSRWVRFHRLGLSRNARKRRTKKGRSETVDKPSNEPAAS